MDFSLIVRQGRWRSAQRRCAERRMTRHNGKRHGSETVYRTVSLPCLFPCFLNAAICFAKSLSETTLFLDAPVDTVVQNMLTRDIVHNIINLEKSIVFRMVVCYANNYELTHTACIGIVSVSFMGQGEVCGTRRRSKEQAVLRLIDRGIPF